VDNGIRDRIGPGGIPSDEGMWKAEEAAAYLNTSKRWVYEKAAAGLLPSHRYYGSSRVRFVPEEIRAYARGEWKPTLRSA
jgi:excisionase family DNA binding protein